MFALKVYYFVYVCSLTVSLSGSIRLVLSLFRHPLMRIIFCQLLSHFMLITTLVLDLNELQTHTSSSIHCHHSADTVTVLLFAFIVRTAYQSGYPRSFQEAKQLIN